MKLRDKAKQLTALILSLCCCLVSCKEKPAPSAEPLPFNQYQNHQNSFSAVTKDAVFWEDGDRIFRKEFDGAKTEIATGKILGAVGEYLYYMKQGGLFCYKDQPIQLAPLETPCILAGATETEVILFGECEVLLLKREAPTQNRTYQLNYDQFGGSAATLDGETLYWFGNNALCKTNLQSKTTETIKDLGYIGTVPPSFYWMGDQLYFYYGYTVYRLENDQVTPLVTYQENTPCVFGFGYGYTAGQILDLQSEKTVRSIENSSGFWANEWGIAYCEGNSVIVVREEELRIPLPAEFEENILCFATPNGALIKDAKNYFLARQNEEGEWILKTL